MKLQFPTLFGIGETLEDLPMARDCYANSLRHLQNLPLPKRMDRDHDVPEMELTTPLSPKAQMGLCFRS